MPTPLTTKRGIASIAPSTIPTESYSEKGLDVIRGIIGIPTNAELKAKSIEQDRRQAEESLYRKQQTDLPYHMQGFAPETIPKEYWLNETDPIGTDKMRVPAYRAGVNSKDTDPKTGLETLPMRGKVEAPAHGGGGASGGWGQTNKKTDPYLGYSMLYARARAMRAAQHLGVPQLTPEELGGLVLQEGGAGMGGGFSDRNSKKQAARVKELREHGVNFSNAEFLAQMEGKYELAKRLKKPFGELWNGTGKNWVKTSGAQYAKNLQKQIEATKQPKNKEFMDIINMGLAHGDAYPHGKPMPKDTPTYRR
jgi:hypothetical protein